MSGVPCPYCKEIIGLDLGFIINNPVSKCPHCETVMKFKIDNEITEKYKKVLSDIEAIKKQYSSSMFSGTKINKK
jgi:phage FluMu protein Com